MTNGKRENPKADEKAAAKKNGVKVVREPIPLDQLPEHVERLREISAIAGRLLDLLGHQFVSVSSVAPIQKGHRTVEELKGRVKSHRDGLENAFDPLREQIEKLKANFWEKNRKSIEATAIEYIKRTVKERVATEVKGTLKRYRDYAENNQRDNDELRTVIDISNARTRNSLLHSKYMHERITWVGGEDPAMSLRDLLHTDETNVRSLAGSLGLPQDEDTQITLNRVFRHLGIQYRPIPSGSGSLLMFITNLG